MIEYYKRDTPTSTSTSLFKLQPAVKCARPRAELRPLSWEGQMAASNHHGLIWVVVKIRALNNRCRILFRTQKGTMILTTTHMGVSEN